ERPHRGQHAQGAARRVEEPEGGGEAAQEPRGCDLSPVDKTMGWCDAHVTSQSDPSRDFHARADDCEHFVSAEDLLPDIKDVLTKLRRVFRLAWLVAVGVYVALVSLLLVTSPASMGTMLLLAAVCLVMTPVLRALTLGLAEAIAFTHEDIRFLP